MFRFLKTTVIGGILFLVPVVIFIAVLAKALGVAVKLAAPLAEILPVDSVGDIAVVQLLALAILVLICFMAGLAAKTSFAGKLVQALETNVLDKIPAYALLKAKTESALKPEDTEDFRPAIVRFNDSLQLAFEIERVPAGKVVIFVPGAPDPWTGRVHVVTEDRVAPLDLPILTAAELMERLGKGSADVLREALAGSEPAPR